MLLIASTYVPWATALAWPLIVVAIVFVFVFTSFGRETLGSLKRNVKQVEAFGISVELTPESAEETRTSFEEGFSQLRANVVREMDASIRATGTHQIFAGLVEILIDTIGRPKANDNKIRATIWIQDLVFSHSLYQLLDYYPRQAGNERGRTMSQRFGIVGLAWRLGKDQVEGSIGKSPEELMMNWAMTRQEASMQGQGRHSFYAIPLHRQGIPFGIFYLDATGEDVFKDKKDQLLIEVIRQRDRLCQSIEIVRTQVVDRTPHLPSFDF